LSQSVVPAALVAMPPAAARSFALPAPVPARWSGRAAGDAAIATHIAPAAVIALVYKRSGLGDQAVVRTKPSFVVEWSGAAGPAIAVVADTIANANATAIGLMGFISKILRVGNGKKVWRARLFDAPLYSLLLAGNGHLLGGLIARHEGLVADQFSPEHRRDLSGCSTWADVPIAVGAHRSDELAKCFVLFRRSLRRFAAAHRELAAELGGKNSASP
jgi:hypothetical protein